MSRKIPELPTGILAPARTDNAGNIIKPELTYEEYYAATNKKHFGDTNQPGSQFTEVKDLCELVKITKLSHGGSFGDKDDRDKLMAIGADPKAFNEETRYYITPTGGRLGAMTSHALPDDTPQWTSMRKSPEATLSPSLSRC